MIIQVRFTLRLEVNEPNVNYTGCITVRRELFSRSQVFFFRFLNPYGGEKLEFNLYLDEAMTNFYGVMLGQEVVGTHQLTDKPITAAVFSEPGTDKEAIAFVAMSIISEAVHEADKDLSEFQNPEKKRPVLLYDGTWEHNFSASLDMARHLLRSLH